MNKFPPPIAMLVCLSLEWLLSRFVPLARLDAEPVRWLGCVLIAFGAVLGISSIGLFARAHTTVVPHGEPSSFVASGPYKITRNPMYLGLAVALFGTAALFGGATGFVAPLLFVAVISAVHIPPEERAMRARFGVEFERYQERVRRWI